MHVERRTRGMTRRCVLALALVTLVAFAAAPVAAGADNAWCTGSYPAECQATVGDVKVACTGVGEVPDCRAG